MSRAGVISGSWLVPEGLCPQHLGPGRRGLIADEGIDVAVAISVDLVDCGRMGEAFHEETPDGFFEQMDDVVWLLLSVFVLQKEGIKPFTKLRVVADSAQALEHCLPFGEDDSVLFHHLLLGLGCAGFVVLFQSSLPILYRMHTPFSMLTSLQSSLLNSTFR